MAKKVSNLAVSPSVAKPPTDKYELSPFEEAVQQALKIFDDPMALAAESPLATEYFLSATLPGSGTVARSNGRGEWLRTVMREAAATLWGGPLPRTYEAMKAALIEERKQRGSSRYTYLVLELRYFRKFLRPRSLRDIYESDEYLLDSKAGDHRSHKVAIQQLAQALLTYCRPAMRPEQPPPALPLLGAEAALQQAVQALMSGHTVALVGPGGIGKTTLGAAIGQALAPRPLFWFTLRPTLNDRLSSLLFSLGHFCHEQGAANLWQFLALQEGHVQDLQLVLALVRQDLHLLAANPPLLCFDELDRLFQLNPEQSDPHYTQLLEFVESLQGHVPLLFMTQRPLLTTDTTITLQGLAVEQLQQLAARVGVQLGADELFHLQRYTQGNPRMTLLALALHQQGEALADTLATLPQRAGLLPLLQRLWTRLRSEERHLLQQLAVFRAFTPEQQWDKAIVERLLALYLVERDGRGGLALIPGLRETLYAELPTELRQELHLAAALVRAQLAEYTAAAYHYWQADQPAQAIALWYPNRKVAIARGEAEAALAIFTSLSARQLDLPERKALDLIRAELRLLAGEIRQSFAEVETIRWWDRSAAAARAHALRGRLQEALGDPDSALDSYLKGAELNLSMSSEVVTALLMAGRIQIRRGNLTEARRLAQLAESNTQLLLGEIEQEQGNYNDALLILHKALLIAQHFDEQPLLARIHGFLARVYGRQKRMKEAVRHIELALTIYETRKDHRFQALMRTELASVYIDNRQFQAVLEPARQAYQFFKSTQSSYMMSVAAANLAEAYFELGDWPQAEHFAQEVLAQEEPQSYAYGLFTLGRLQQARTNWAAAAAHFAEIIRITEANGDTFMVAYAQRELGAVYQASGRTSEARQALHAALRLFEQMEIADEIAKTQVALQALQ
ncbi:MAG: AAA family ATPase [Caldilinea sp. CFX5]|nr:AAA family ATPase [Caldilinea sp. CFX5]